MIGFLTSDFVEKTNHITEIATDLRFGKKNVSLREKSLELYIDTTALGSER
jgi:hypothetical protein